MKKLFLITFLLWSVLASAQLSISTNLRQDATWSNADEKWNVFSTDEGGTLFEFNKEFTTFRHTTATISSDYYIKSVDYNDETVLYTMTVTSDVGNEYELIIDGINECVAFFYWKDDVYYLVRHTIKNSWIREK